MKGIGRLVQLGIYKESTRGTTPSTPNGSTFWVAWNDGLIEEMYENVVDVEAYGKIADSQNVQRVKNWAEGSVKAPISDKSFPLMLLSLLGQDNPTLHSGETTVYDHALSVTDNSQHQSLSLYLHDPIANQDYSYANAVVSKLEIDYSLKSFMNYSATFMGQAGVKVSTISVSQTPEFRFTPQHMAFKTCATYSGMNAGGISLGVKSLKLTVDQNIEADDVLGQITPRDFLTKDMSVKGTVEVIFQNETDLKANALANTQQALRIDLLNSDTVIGTAANPEVRIDLPKVFFTKYSLPRKVNDLIYQTVEFQAVLSITDGFQIQALCTNKVVSY